MQLNDKFITVNITEQTLINETFGYNRFGAGLREPMSMLFDYSLCQEMYRLVRHIKTR